MSKFSLRVKPRRVKPRGRKLILNKSGYWCLTSAERGEDRLWRTRRLSLGTKDADEALARVDNLAADPRSQGVALVHERGRFFKANTRAAMGL